MDVRVVGIAQVLEEVPDGWRAQSGLRDVDVARWLRARVDHSTEEVHAFYEAGDVEIRMPNIGDGIRLFGELDGSAVPLRRTQVVAGANATHLRSEIANRGDAAR